MPEFRLEKASCMLAVIQHVTNSAKNLTFTPLEPTCPTI